MPDAPRTARARARQEITAEILASARRQLGEVGAASLSLRAVSRDLGMASSAIYRYFESRDALLTALIVGSFDAVGEIAERALHDSRGGSEARWLAVANSIRQWAVDHPHDYALVYGSPVPGYQAPDDTVTPAARVSMVMLGLVADGIERGDIVVAATASVPRPVHADFARLRDLAAPTVPDELLGRALVAWNALFGAISYELFGHLHRIIEDHDPYFDHQMQRVGAFLVRGPNAA